MPKGFISESSTQWTIGTRSIQIFITWIFLPELAKTKLTENLERQLKIQEIRRGTENFLKAPLVCQEVTFGRT
jgi:hypothetical protein